MFALYINFHAFRAEFENVKTRTNIHVYTSKNLNLWIKHKRICSELVVRENVHPRFRENYHFYN